MPVPAVLSPMNESQQKKNLLLRQELNPDTNCGSPYSSRLDDNIKIDVIKIVFNVVE